MQLAVLLHGDRPSESDWTGIETADAIICADGALDWLHERRLIPAVLVGDLDSASQEALAWLETTSAQIQRSPNHKDATDGELALDAALGLAPDRIEIYGALGGRLGMQLANLKLLRRGSAAEVDTVIVSENERARYLRTGSHWDLGAYRDGTLNVLATTDAARVVLHGTAWAGEAHLPGDSAKGVSNRIQTYQARVEVVEGAVLATVER